MKKLSFLLGKISVILIVAVTLSILLLAAKIRGLQSLVEVGSIPCLTMGGYSLFRSRPQGVLLRVESAPVEIWELPNFITKENRTKQVVVAWESISEKWPLSPDVMLKTSTSLIKSCKEVSVVAFALDGSDWMVAYGLKEDGRVEHFGRPEPSYSHEDGLDNHRKLPWETDICCAIP